MQRRSELGSGRLSGLFWLVVLAVVVYAAVKVGPVYYAHYSLQDRMGEVARTAYSVKSDEELKSRFFEAAQEYGLDPFLGPHDFVVERTVGRIKVSARYSRNVHVLPGWDRTFDFVAKTDQPLF